jgi:hypothetical protein
LTGPKTVVRPVSRVVLVEEAVVCLIPTVKPVKTPVGFLVEFTIELSPVTRNLAD